MYIDSDYKEENREFVVRQDRFADLNDLIAEFRQKYQIRWTPIIDPVLAVFGPENYTLFEQGRKADAYVSWPAELQDKVHVEKNLPDKRFWYSHMWPEGPVAFVDFFKTSGRQFWKEMLKHLHEKFHFDALWDDMNEPATWKGDNCPADKYSLVRRKCAEWVVHKFHD